MALLRRLGPSSSIPCETSTLVVSTTFPRCYLLRTPSNFRQPASTVKVRSSKIDSRLLDSFISSQFRSLKFSAVHPLYYKEHLGRSSYYTLPHLGSRILASYVSCHTTVEEVENLLIMLKKNATIVKMIKPGMLITSVADLYDLCKDEIAKAGALTKVVVEKLYMMEEATSIKSPLNMNTVDDDSNPKLRDIVKSGLGKAIKRANASKVKDFKQYCMSL